MGHGGCAFNVAPFRGASQNQTVSRQVSGWPAPCSHTHTPNHIVSSSQPPPKRGSCAAFVPVLKHSQCCDGDSMKAGRESYEKLRQRNSGRQPPTHRETMSAVCRSLLAQAPSRAVWRDNQGFTSPPANDVRNRHADWDKTRGPKAGEHGHLPRATAATIATN